MVYSTQFYKRRREITLVSSQVVLEHVWGVLQPNSVLDVGCGTGTWLAQSQRFGAERICGIDGPWVPEKDLEISRESFVECNLSDSLPENLGRYDLALCIEVAEHLTQDGGDRLIEFLTSSSNAILFSAAIPGQGGTGHINEQLQSYWHDRFQSFDFACFDVIRPLIWDDESVNVIYRQNMLMYIRRGSDAEDVVLQQFPQPNFSLTKFDLNRAHPHLLETRSSQSMVRTLFRPGGWPRRLFEGLFRIF